MAAKDREFDVTKVPHSRGADFVSIYANSAQVSVGFYDLSLIFAQIGLTSDGTPAVQERAMVAMSLEHAKALMVALRGQLEEYEKNNGPIRSRPDRRANTEAGEETKEQSRQTG